jgi:hypothetical protein
VTPAEQELKQKRLEALMDQDMTAWFNPGVLARTGVRSMMAAVFGSYADKRELQAALGLPAPFEEYDYDSVTGEFWMDFVADLGDGFDSTFTVASLLAQSSLDVSGASSPLQRGKVLVMGGDQVYPAATRENYRDRLYGPYEAALPHADEPGNPHLYALPGNHDWYDGLTSFLRLFAQKRWIGGWQTKQSRSYFAAKLPGPWWLWGVDLSLTADMDDPQRKYFEATARSVKAGDRIILCTGDPAWVKCGMHVPHAFDVHDFFLKKVVPAHAEVPVMLTGDLHHYARYERREPGEDHAREHLITAGGGGAYLASTHNLPGTITIPRTKPDDSRWTQDLRRAAVYPPASTSRSLAARAPLFLWRNHAFAGLLAALYVLFGWLLVDATGRPLVGLFQDVPWPSAMQSVGRAMFVDVGSTIFALLIVAGLALFASSDFQGAGRAAVARTVGAVHGVAHLVMAVSLMWGLAQASFLNETIAMTGVYVAALAFFGTIGAGLLMGAYLFVTNWSPLRLHDNEVFSSQSIADYKNFLRLKFDPSGALTIYPIAVDRVNRKWKAQPDAGKGEPWIVPESGDLPDCHLAEDPIVIPGRPQPQAMGTAVAAARHVS